MAARDIRLLSLDGGGVRGLSTLYILKNILEKVVGPGKPIPKPCEYFDLIGGTSTGGLIAIMLGRLGMTVDECIDAYTNLSKEIFDKKKGRLPFNYKMELSTQFDSKKLEQVIKSFDGAQELLASETAATAKCKVIVCAVRRSNSQPAFLRSYPSTASNELAQHTAVWEACRATSAAPGFFDPISIGPNKQELIDGGLGYNNPVYVVYNEARDIWGPSDAQLQQRLVSLLSIGAGVPKPRTLEPGLRKTLKTLSKIVSDTQTTADQFHRDRPDLGSQMQYFRFNVDNGLQGIGLEEHHKQSIIADATSSYLDRPDVKDQLLKCASTLQQQAISTPSHNLTKLDPLPTRSVSDERFRVQFSLAGVPFADKFVDRPDEMKAIMSHLLPSEYHGGRETYVLHGMGGIGKTQLAARFFTQFGKCFTAAFWLKANTEQDLRLSLIKCARRIPAGGISEFSRKTTPKNSQEEQNIIEEVLAWLAKDENHDWLLVFDNVDLDPDLEADKHAGAYDLQDYMSAQHGRVLITTRLKEIAQLATSEDGDSSLSTVSLDVSRQIFEKWIGRSALTSLGPEYSRASEELLGPDMLGGLPLAIAQAAIYIKKTGIPIREYKERYMSMWKHVMDIAGNTTPIQGYHRSVGTTWSLSLQQVERRDPNASSLVRTWAFLDNKDFWFGLFSELADSSRLFDWYPDGLSADDWNEKYKFTETPEWIKTFSQNEAAYLESMNTLLEFGLVGNVHQMEEGQGSQNIEDFRGGFTMHPVVHAWAKQMQSSAEEAQSLRNALCLFITGTPVYEWKWSKKQRWLPHVVNCNNWVMKAWNEEAGRTLTWLNDLYSATAMHRMAWMLHCVDFYERVVASLGLLESTIRYDSSDGANNCGSYTSDQSDHTILVPQAQLWSILYLYGSALYNFGQYSEAKVRLERALQLTGEGAGGSISWVMALLNLLSKIYQAMDDVARAKDTALKVATLWEALPPAKRTPPLLLKRAVNLALLGSLHTNMGEFIDADEKLQEAFSIAEELGNLYERSNPAFWLGVLWNRRGQPKKAEECLRKISDYQLEKWGEGHHNSRLIFGELAWALALQGKAKAKEAQRTLELAFSCTRIRSTIAALHIVADHVGAMAKRGEKNPGMEPILKRSWDEAFRILQVVDHGSLGDPGIVAVFKIYTYLLELYLEQDDLGLVDELREQQAQVGLIDLFRSIADAPEAEA